MKMTIEQTAAGLRWQSDSADPITQIGILEAVKAQIISNAFNAGPAEESRIMTVHGVDERKLRTS